MILLEEVQHLYTLTPQMMASFMALLGKGMGCVQQSVSGTFAALSAMARFAPNHESLDVFLRTQDSVATR